MSPNFSARQKKSRGHESYMNETKNSMVGVLVLLGIVALVAYSIGVSTGRNQSLDDAYISYCDNNGDYCYLETKYTGETEINCDELKKCFATDKSSNELEQQEVLKEAVDKILRE